MKKGLKAALIVVLIFVVVLGALAIWQRENVKVFFMSLHYSTEEIDAMLAKNNNKIDRVLNKLTENEMRPLSPEEGEKLLNGEISAEEALDLIKSEANAENAEKSDASEANGGKSSKQPVDSRVDDIISKIYLLRAEYTNMLSGLESGAVAGAKKMPEQERTISRKLAYVESYTGRAVALERQCDSKMEQLLAELKAELQRTGGNVGMVSEIRSVYASEKSLKKSQLLSKYGKYLK